MIKGFMCSQCGYFYKDHIVIYNRVCNHCGHVEKSDYKHPVVEENEIKLKLCQEKIREILKIKWLENINGNFNK